MTVKQLALFHQPVEGIQSPFEVLYLDRKRQQSIWMFMLSMVPSLKLIICVLSIRGSHIPCLDR